MLKRSTRAAVSVLLALCMIVSMFVVMTVSVYADEQAEAFQGLDAVPDPIDPQSWKLQRDMDWSDLRGNPVVDWMKELNPAGLSNPKAAGSREPIVGGLILIEYLDRKFISSQPIGSDSLGYYLAGDDKITYNPIMTVPRENLAQWWADYLNKPQEINHYLTIDEFWRENSYGKWAIELDPQGPFTIPFFEFETMGYDIGSRFQTVYDIPPTFRPDSGSAQSFDQAAIRKAIAEGVPFNGYDFFFLLHAGYDESGVWQEFGQSQFETRKDVPYELGPGPIMKRVEEIFTADPDLLDVYVERYPAKTVFSEAAARRDALKAEGKLSEFEFKLPQEDWDWVNGYNDQTQQNTRYVPFTAWQAAVSEWSHMSTARATAYPELGRDLSYSTQGESDGMAGYAHEFGHVTGMGDNYGNPWTAVASPDTEPWDLMSRGSFAGPFGDHARWTVPGVEAGSVPVHMSQGGKKANNYYDPGDLLSVSVQELSQRTPIVAEIVARHIPLNTQYNDFGVSRNKFVKGIELVFGTDEWADQAQLLTTGYTWTQKRALRMGVEVVDQQGYDSYTNDHGVLITRINSNSGRQIIDSHLYDIDMVDYYLKGEAYKYPLGHAAQLADAAFHAGISSVDTGYYSYTTGGVVSGDTVNEFHDPFNKLNFYILQKNMNDAKYGQFMSCQVGVLRTDGVPVGGELIVEKGKLESADPGKVAVQYFTVTNTGDKTDIVRVGVSGTLPWDKTILNNLYAIGAGVTITIPVYIEVPEDISAMGNYTLILTATSESNREKSGSSTVEDIDDDASTLGIILEMPDTEIVEGQYFWVNTKLTRVASSNVVALDYVFDKDVLEYASIELPDGVQFVRSEETADGILLMLMVDDYAMKDLVKIMFLAKPNFEPTDKLLSVTAQLVVKNADDTKKIVVLSSEVGYDILPIGKDLIFLSNVIDKFGMEEGKPGWNEAKSYDYIRDGVINILDITYVAGRISF